MASSQISYRDARLQDMKQFPSYKTSESFNTPRCIINFQNVVWYAVLSRLNDHGNPTFLLL